MAKWHEEKESSVDTSQDEADKMNLQADSKTRDEYRNEKSVTFEAGPVAGRDRVMIDEERLLRQRWQCTYVG